MTILSTFGGTSGVDTGDIPASLRFRSAASAYLSRTFGTPTSQTRGLISLWYKPGWLLGGLCNAVFLSTANPTTSGLIIGGTGAFGSTYENRLFIRNGGATKDYWNLVFRDPTSLYHIVVSFDTTQGTQADRAKCWVNGVEQTKGGSSLGASEAIGFLASGTQTINGNLASYYGDQYLARFVLMDGQCVQQSTASVSSFGYFNTEINEWVSKSQSAVKTVVDAGGTNSFMLDFDDATSLTTLGYDKSSKGNNWTLNNFSLTAGTTYDHMLDVPGNSFCTWNQLFPTTNTISNGSLRGATAASVNAGYGVRSTMSMASGKYEAEITPTASADTWSYVGVCPASLGVSDVSSAGSNAVLYRAGNGNKNVNGTATAYGASWTTEAIRIAVDMDARTVTFYKAGVSQGAIALPSSTENYIFVIANGNATTFTADANFGQQPITLDSGYKALCQRNMPDPAILNPELHMDVVTWTGTAATKSITGLLFQPDLVEMKSRGRALDWAYYDSVRGVEKRLESNTADAEVTGDTTGLTAFNSDGWTMGALDQINGTTATNSFAGWAWKAGGTPVTNNAGSISSQVSANVEAGFSVVTYTSPNNAADQTVGHGLTKAPGLIIAKNRISGVLNWDIYHSALASGYGLSFTTTASTAGRWPTTAPTSSVFSTKNTYEHNGTDTYVAYCFAEIAGFSKIFSYTGNGSADGPYVDCGFKPKYVLVKCSGSTGTWRIYDAARPGYNVIGGTLQAESSAAESTAAEVDFTANGFKLRVATDPNTATTYIGIAFADVAGKYSLGR